MNNRVMYDQNNRRFERVTRTTAERAYNNGLAVVACPVNLRPFAPWHPEAVLTRQEGETFAQAVNACSYYNCNRESGRYLAFYLPLMEVDRFTSEKPTAATLGTVKAYDYSFMTA